MTKDEAPLYKSAPSKRSMGNEYSIYADRIELKCRFPFVTKTFVIKKDDLISIGTCKPPALGTSIRGLKLDLADLNEHVRIKRKKGWFRQLRFTPANPEEFVAKARATFDSR